MLMMTDSMSEGWYALVLVRVAAGLLHVVTAGLTGWAFASAVSQQKKNRLVGVYVIAIGLHGLWNAFAVMLGVLPMFSGDVKVSFPMAAALAEIAPYGLVIMAVGMLITLFVMNRHLQRTRDEEESLLLPPQPPPLPVYVPPVPPDVPAAGSFPQ